MAGNLEKAALSLAALSQAASQVEPEPTDAKKASGNYAKGHISWKGLDITIETPKGGVRSGTSKDGKPWRTTMTAHYGYIKGTKSDADGDHIDVFLSDSHLDSEIVFVVNQLKENGRFDEHKAVLGCVSEEEARKLYLSNYSKGWTGLGSIKPMTLLDFKEWLEKGDTSKQAADLLEYDCPHCGGTAYNGNPQTGDRYRGSGECVDCGQQFSIVGLKLQPREKQASYYPTLYVTKCAADKPAAAYTIAVDLDGTLAEQEEPFDPKTIGKPRTGAKKWMKKFHEAGARLIVFTVRGDNKLVEDWLKEHDVPYDHINENPDQPPDSSGKVFAHLYYDDRALDGSGPWHKNAPEVLKRIEAHGA